jgi:hypothetical protein
VKMMSVARDLSIIKEQHQDQWQACNELLSKRDW